MDALVGTTTLNIELLGFVTILLLIFGLFLLLAGVFTAYFGSGKSRTIGVLLLVGGIVVGVLIAYIYHMQAHNLGPLLWGTFEVLAAAVIGGLVAIAIFLVAIMKS
ncbi:MAG: hypothetical protein L3K04_05960 [Thermoplasmata archaeon]|nr:hypothetical protein [Thermoplasmata archaeon]MCI4338027.1 hypothetical protein [Thermoplasmata archaeon]MCI4341235.1 hypothetical protein [Thermoplasmata archaeon]